MTVEQDTQQYAGAFVSPGRGGWGKGLTLVPDEKRNKVISVTGGGIHAVAQRIADVTGAIAIDGFRNRVPDDEILCAVINCGGTARIGVYPRKGIYTIDVFPGAPGGPLAQFITDDLFVSAVGPGDVTPVTVANPGVRAGDSGVSVVGSQPTSPDAEVARGLHEFTQQPAGPPTRFDTISGVFVKLGSGIGYLVNTMLASGRQAITITINTILPFMAYVSLLLGFVIYTGVAKDLGTALKPLSSNPIGLIVIGAIVTIPVLSPILGPGAAVAQIIGVLMGTQIANGNLPVQYALPTLFAIDGQVGCDFIPVGLGLGEAQPETVAVGTPAVLFSRQITSPIAVVIAYFASFGLK